MHADLYDRLVEEIHNEFPGFRLVRKDRSAFQRFIHHALVAITFGRMRRYLDGYQTTIGKTVYVTSDWDDWDPRDRYITLSHERVHLRQFRRYTLPLMAILYLLVPFPMVFSYFRARFEMRAYEETLRAAASVYGLDYVRSDWFRDDIIGQFTGPSYGWMWPFRRQLERWYDGAVARLEGATPRGDTKPGGGPA